MTWVPAYSSDRATSAYVKFVMKFVGEQMPQIIIREGETIALNPAVYGKGTEDIVYVGAELHDEGLNVHLSMHKWNAEYEAELRVGHAPRTSKNGTKQTGLERYE